MKSNPESIRCGKVGDCFDSLKKMCEEEAKKLCETLDMAHGCEKEIPFWTSDFPELICTGKFTKSDNGVIYELDYSQSTL